VAESGLPTVGIVGGGQLARMLYQDAISLDIPLHFLVASKDETITQLSSKISIGSPKNAKALELFIRDNDIVTFEHELVDLEVLAELENEGATIRPSSRALKFAVDKWAQREELSSAGLPVPSFAAVVNEDSVASFAESNNWPVVLKARTGGYDGRGVWVVDSIDEASAVLAEAAKHDIELYVEQMVNITEEIAVLIVRDINGNTITYPVVHSVQEDGICRETTVENRPPTEVEQLALDIAEKIADCVDSCGVLAVEMFVSGDDVLINELAMRPHNTGHFSIEGSVTSQFENHLRAVSGLPLGATDLTAPAVVMVNILGAVQPLSDKDIHQALIIPGVHLHMYGKEWRKGRKIGHITVCADTVREARDRAYAAANILEPTN
jgi:5-(carboxyamino)imidazole ribonucleotide synthase